MEIYTVKNGDSVYKIAKRLGTTPGRIIADNGLIDPSRLSVGQTLVITHPAETYTVQAGDTVYSIADRFELRPSEIWQNNPDLRGEERIYPGQVLVIRYEGDRERTVAVNGYAYPFIDKAVLKQTLPYLTYLSIFTYGLRENGSLIPPDGDEDGVIRLAAEYDVRPLMMLTSLTENGTFSNELVNHILGDRTIWERLADDVIIRIRQEGYRGLDIDFEYISPEYRDVYPEFLSYMREALEPYGLPLFVSLAPKTSADQPGLLYEAHQYGLIGESVDYALLMTYEWGYTYGPPMPVSPINEVEKVIRYAETEIPTEKLLLGIPNYAYDWPLPYVRGKTEADAISNIGAVERAQEKDAMISYDDTTETPFYTYYTRPPIGGENIQHVVWFDDARSMEAKLRLVDSFDLYGFSVWNIMRYFPGLWSVLNGLYRVMKLPEGDSL